MLKKILMAAAVMALITNINSCRRMPSAVPSPSARPENDSGTRIAAYARTSWGMWDAEDIQGEYLTDLMLAFTTIAGDDHVSLGNINLYWYDWKRIDRLKELHPHLRVNLSVGGWGADNFSQMARDPEKRAQFIENCITVIRERNVDGIDIDWEYPVGPPYWYRGGAMEMAGVRGGTPPITVSIFDKVHYIELLSELRIALNALGNETGKYYYLSTCVPADDWFINRNDVKAAAEIVDNIKLMAYDYVGSWTANTGYHANLHPGRSGANSTSRSVEAYLAASVPPHKLMLGLATYGKQWQGVPAGNNPSLPGLYQTSDTTNRGIDVGYSQTIIQYLLPDSGFTRYWDDTAKASFLYNPDLNGGTWVCYLDEEQIKYITAYAKEKNLGGIFYWEWYWDRDADLLRVMYEEMAD